MNKKYINALTRLLHSLPKLEPKGFRWMNNAPLEDLNDIYLE